MESTEHIIDLACVPTGVVCTKLAILLNGTIVADSMTILGVISMGMIIVVNAPKFFDQIRKWKNGIFNFIKLIIKIINGR